MKISKNHKLILSAMVFFMMAACVYSYPPDNAAVLYYNAAMQYEVDDEMADMLSDLSKNKIEVNDKIRELVKKYRIAIDTVLDAAEVKNCDWGMNFSHGLEMVMPHLSKMKQLSRLVIADAMVLAADADYDAAIYHCMSLYKMARHTNDRNIIGYLVGTAINGMANECIAQIMAEMPQDSQIIASLKNDLIEIDSIPFSIKPAILGEREAMLMSMTPEQLPDIARLCALEKSTKAKLLALDSAAIDRNREYYKNHFAGIINAFDMPYVEGYGRLMDLVKKIEKDVENDPDLILTGILHPPLAKVFSISVRSKTHNNAIRAAIEVYLVKAKTGKLPDKLPAGLPKDLFSGKDFEYEKTADGFILRCQGEELGKGEIHEYKFGVKK